MPTTVCWFVQSHRDPEQILRLVRTLRGGSRGPIVLRHDPRGAALDRAPFEAIPDVRFLPPGAPQIRASFDAQMQPYLDVVDRLERDSVAYDWLVNLTAQDYPVTPVAAIEAELARTRRDGFARRWDVASAESPWSRRKARARYAYRYRLLPARFEPWLRRLRFVTRIAPIHFYLDYGAWVGVRRFRTPFRESFRCHGGIAWWTLRRSVVRHLRDFLAAHPEVERHYRGTIAPEESMVPTILAAAPGFDLATDDFRYVDYSRAVRGSPRTLTLADLPELTSGRYHFARKFDFAVDRDVVDRIDREVHGIATT